LADGTTLPSQLVTDYPPALEQVVLKALVRDKKDRFASAREMMEALEAALPPEARAEGERATEPLLRRLFEARIAERALAMNAAIRRADGDVAALELIDPRYPLSHPSMRAVAMRTSEGMLAASDGSLPISEGVLRVAGGSSEHPERSRIVVKSFHPKAKRQGWPALLAVAAVAPIVVPPEAHSSPVPPPPPQSATAATPAPAAGDNPPPTLMPGASRDGGASEKSAAPRSIVRPRPLLKKPTVVEEQR
jgi:serine/threonine-protein kinase